VGAEVSVGFLVDAVRLLGAQHDTRSALVDLELIKRVLDLPALVVEHAKLSGWCVLGIEDRGQQPVALLRV
jgi:hypothetical protein